MNKIYVYAVMGFYALISFACGLRDNEFNNDQGIDPPQTQKIDKKDEKNQQNQEKLCFYNGKVYQTGDVFPAKDGCNSCSCNPEGFEGIGCSAMDCGTVVDPCPLNEPAPGTPCEIEGAECKFVATYCPQNPMGPEYQYEHNLYRCTNHRWDYHGQDCYDCCNPWFWQPKSDAAISDIRINSPRRDAGPEPY